MDDEIARLLLEEVLDKCLLKVRVQTRQFAMEIHQTGILEQGEEPKLSTNDDPAPSG